MEDRERERETPTVLSAASINLLEGTSLFPSSSSGREGEKTGGKKEVKEKKFFFLLPEARLDVFPFLSHLPFFWALASPPMKSSLLSHKKVFPLFFRIFEFAVSFFFFPRAKKRPGGNTVGSESALKKNMLSRNKPKDDTKARNFPFLFSFFHLLSKKPSPAKSSVCTVA